MTPLEILATSLAYVIHIDGETTTEEKASLLSLLGKHVARNDISRSDLQALTQNAFRQARETPFDDFLKTVPEQLSGGQQAALLFNLYDVMLADGKLADGERQMVMKFERSLVVDEATRSLARQVLACKNDTSVFTNPLHERNESGYNFSLAGKAG